MLVSTLTLVVIGSCVAAHIGDNIRIITVQQTDDADGELYIEGRLGAGEHLFDSMQMKSHRRRRALVSVNEAFRKSWKAILDTTYGYSNSIWGNKRFVKVGTMNDAMKDFISLTPTRIDHNANHIDGGLRGYVGDQIVELREQLRGQPILVISSGEDARDYGVANSNRVERFIVYVKNAKEAKQTINIWKGIP